MCRQPGLAGPKRCRRSLPPVPGERPLWIGQESLNPQSVESVNKSGVIAIDTDNEYMLNRFANNTTNAVNWIASLVANTNVIYERDVSIHLFQGYTILRVSTTADPYTVNDGGNADGNALNEFSSYWGAHYGSIKRTVAAMLSGKQPGGGSVRHRMDQRACAAPVSATASISSSRAAISSATR